MKQEGLCRLDPKLDAVLRSTDIVAAGVLFECGRRGWKVPQRLAIAGSGDYEIASEITPGLTTLEPHAYEMGQEAMNMIIQRVTGHRPRRKVVDTGFHIIKRASA